MKYFFKDGLFMVQEKTMIITGSSKLSISPDITRLSFSIKTQETCYEQTLSYLSDNAESLINVLTLNNFLEKEIKTTRYSIHRWTKYENGQEHHLGYEGEHHLFVEFKIDNERINKIIDEVSTKVPCVSINISYSCSHLEKYDKKLIELAIKDAKSKATIIAKASNVNLKQIKTINYSTQQLDVNFGLEYNHLRTDKCFASRVPNMTPENKVLEKSITMIWEID